MHATRSQDRILTEALRLFSSGGYEATSVREICEAAEITKPTLYHFYGSKEGVYRALVDGALEDFRSGIERALVPPGSVRDRLKRMARAYFDSALAHRERTRFIMGLIHNTASSSAPVTHFPQFYEEVVGLVAVSIDGAVAAGELQPGNTHHRLIVLMGALGEALCGFLIVGRPELNHELADGLVDTILAGWTRPVRP